MPTARRAERARPPGALVVLTWNVAGLRALLRRRPAALGELVEREGADVLCLQETKLQAHHVEEISAAIGLEGWQEAWACASLSLGRAGVAVLCRRPAALTPDLPRVGPELDGRVITADLGFLRLVNVYSPNAGEGLRNIDARTRRFDPALGRHLEALGAPKILVGDLNVAPEPIDVYDPQRMARLDAPGYSRRERASFRRHFTSRGLVDAFRLVHPEARAYSFFSYRARMRAKGLGWRLDHFLVSQDLAARVSDCYIAADVEGSDHLPVALVLDLRGL